MPSSASSRARPVSRLVLVIAGLLGLLGGVAGVGGWRAVRWDRWRGRGLDIGGGLDALAFGRAHAGAAQALVDGEEVAQREVGAGEEVVDAGLAAGLVVVGEGADEAHGLQLGEAEAAGGGLVRKCMKPPRARPERSMARWLSGSKVRAQM
jgi:hypothetical protein